MSHSALGLPVLLVGHSQISVPGVAQLALVLGVPGISALMTALNCGLAHLIFDPARSIILPACLLSAWAIPALCGLAVATSFHPPSRSEGRSVLVVQPNLSRQDRWDPLRQESQLHEITDYTEAAVAGEEPPPDLVLWPENLITSLLEADPKLQGRLENEVARLGVPIVTGLVRAGLGEAPGRYRSSAVWWDPKRGPIDFIDKARAVPLIESSRRFPGFDALSALFGDRRDWASVEESEVRRPMIGSFRLTTVLCFEVLFPAEVDARRDPQSPAIVNLADDSWVNDEAADAQLVTAAAFRAIEQRLPLLRVSHGGVSVSIDPLGRVRTSLAPNEFAHFRAELGAPDLISVEERLAIAGLPLGGMMLLGLAFVLHRALSSRSSRPSRLTTLALQSESASSSSPGARCRNGSPPGHTRGNCHVRQSKSSVQA